MKTFSSPDAILLLLDSDPLTRAVLHDALHSAGYMVLPAADLGAAVDRVREVPPDLLITRPYIGNMRGAVAGEYLRHKRPGLPVLILGGFMDDDRPRDRNAIHDFHCFPPPFSRDQLLASVREVLRAVRKPRTASA